MTKEKDDLTRIEDLAELIHELQNEVDNEGQSEASGDAFSTTEFGEENFASFDPTEETSEEPPQDDPTRTFSLDKDALNTGDDISDMVEETFKGNDDFTSSVDFDSPNFSLPEEKSDFIGDSSDLDFTMDAAAAATPDIAPYQPDKEFKTPENFADVKKFAESTSFTGMGMEGNPSFSLLIRNVRFIEDVSDIITLLRELELLGDGEENIKARLMRGQLLVPRISEYAGILLAHKLRRFDIDIQLGLADEIHPPRHQENPEVGMVSKHSLYQNHAHQFHFDDPKLEVSQVIVTSTQSLEGYQVVRYVGVASEHKMIEGHIIEDETSPDIPRHYQELAQKLKAHAVKAHSNAVVGLNYQLTPLPSEYGASHNKYRLSCTGNLVWVNKL